MTGPTTTRAQGGEGKGEKEHRGTEKLCEYKTIEQSLPDRGRGEEQVRKKRGRASKRKEIPFEGGFAS